MAIRNKNYINHQIIGSEIDGTSHAFQLIVSNYLNILKPPRGLMGNDGHALPSFDPDGHFITSGDAVQKTEQLCRDLIEYRQLVEHGIERLEDSKQSFIDFHAACSAALDNAKRMKSDLIKARGTAIFMECEWIERILLVVPKNPRLRQR